MGGLRALAPALALALAAAGSAGAAPALIQNGDFADGSGDRPRAWRAEAWQLDLSRFGWTPDADGRGTVHIASATPNDARWCQTVPVRPGGLYRIAARVRTADVPDGAAGAFVSIEPRVADSHLVTGTTDWQTLEVTARAAAPTTSWDVCLRLGSYGNLNSGAAWFTDVSATLVGLEAPRARGPSATARAWRAARETGWLAVAIPLGGGLLLAFGLGLFRRE